MFFLEGGYIEAFASKSSTLICFRYFNHIGAVSGIVVPKKWTDIAITARDHGGHVPANFQMELDNWFASAHPGILDADTYVNMRISLYYNNSKYFMGEHIAKLIELITHFTEKLVREAERRSSSSLGGMGSLSIGFPSQNNPFRELLLKICSMSWRTYCSYFNDDEGDIVELASSTHQNNCRSSILGLRIMCPAYQSNPLTLELRKLASITYFNLINEVFDRFIGNYVWGGQSNTLAIKRLCCGGFVCRNMSPSSSMNSWSTSIALCTSGPTNHSTGVNGMIPLSKITASVTTSSADTAVNISNSMETSNKDGNDDDNDVAMDDVVVTSTADQQQPLHHAASLQQQQYTPTTSFAFASSSVSANKATSASVQPQSATTPPSTQLPLTRGSIQVVELDHRPGIIVWLRVSIDEDFIRTPPPLKSDPVYLVKSLTNNPL